MLRKLRNKPLWYRLWVLLVSIGAVHVLVRAFTSGLVRGDYVVMVFVHFSILLDSFLYPADVPASGE